MAIPANKKARSSSTRTKGHTFRGTTSFRRTLPRGALITLTVLLTLRGGRVLSGLAVTGLPVPIYYAPFVSAAHFFSSHAGRRSTAGSAGASSRWPHLLYQRINSLLFPEAMHIRLVTLIVHGNEKRVNGIFPPRDPCPVYSGTGRFQQSGQRGRGAQKAPARGSTPLPTTPASTKIETTANKPTCVSPVYSGRVRKVIARRFQPLIDTMASVR